MILQKRFWALALALLVMLGCAQAQAMNILLIGVDASQPGENGRSDTMILVRADAQQARLSMVSFLRDLYVSIPGVGRTRLNAAYQHGGEALLRQTLSQNFQVEIDRAVTVHFSLLSELVDELGGVEIDLTDAERRQINREMPDGQQLSEAGVQRLNGEQALAYSRIRKIDSDFQRTSRQQTLLLSMMKSAGELGYWEMLKLALRYLPKVETDLGFSDIVSLAPLVTQLDTLDVRLSRVPFDGAFSEETVNGMMVLSPDLDRCRRELAEFLQ